LWIPGPNKSAFKIMIPIINCPWLWLGILHAYYIATIFAPYWKKTRRYSAFVNIIIPFDATGFHWIIDAEKVKDFPCDQRTLYMNFKIFFYWPPPIIPQQKRSIVKWEIYANFFFQSPYIELGYCFPRT